MTKMVICGVTMVLMGYQEIDSDATWQMPLMVASQRETNQLKRISWVDRSLLGLTRVAIKEVLASKISFGSYISDPIAVFISQSD